MIIQDVMRVFSKNERRKILYVVVIQIFLGGLDLIGVAFIGILGALAISGIQSQNPGNRVSSVIEHLGLSSTSFQNQIAILAGIATALLVTRTVLSIFFSRKIIFFLSRQSAKLSSSLLSKLLGKSMLFMYSRSAQENLYALTSGVNSMTLGVIGSTVSLIADGSLLLIMSIGLFVVDPIIALSTFGVFSIISLSLYYLLQKRARRLGELEAELNIHSNEKILEVINSYREISVKNRKYYYANEISKIRFELSNTMAETSFMPNISKYVIEITVVIGALLVSAVQFILQDAPHAVATLAIFLAAGTRIAPAILRIQQGAIVIRGSIAAAKTTLTLLDELNDAEQLEETNNAIDYIYNGFSPNIKFTDVSFCYPEKSTAAVKSATLELSSGSTNAFVGPSGAGKTTIVDLLLGLLEPSNGEILISNVSPQEAITNWPGSISYVPQDIQVINGSVLENVIFGYPKNTANLDRVWKVLELAQLTETINSLSSGLDSHVGEYGKLLSGGQRQRLGIARALYSNPKLLVLDEATSSLDGQTEYDISEAIQKLKGEVTIVVVAHRLSTIRKMDNVIYMDLGKIIAFGSFEDVRNQVPDFEKQAQLMGL
jgi:ABC-type multidrug transport system fused ATPase/permease subunit